jgi:hypothetical protein
MPYLTNKLRIRIPRDLFIIENFFSFTLEVTAIHHHKHQGLDPFTRSVSRVTTALANVYLIFQLFSFIVVCSDMFLKGFGLVAFFASIKPVPSVFVYLVQYAFSLQFTAYGVVCFVVIKGAACQRSQ